MKVQSLPLAAAHIPGERALVAAVALGAMLAPLNSTMIAVALPRLVADLGANPGAAAWLVTAYLIVMAALQPLAGTLGDRLGRRRLVLAGVAGFGLASVVAALATSLPALVALRALQGVSGALALPNAVALLREHIP
ncbi:MAG TPA: MFS transporter, partial [Roseiflexaceae bacterium]|nr:MFS transporter [Roseiflexaceae bacterium]